MKNRLKNINFYLTSIAAGSSIDAVSNTGTFKVNAVTVSGYQLTDGGNQIFWVVVDSNLENNRELFRITDVDLATKILTFDKRSGPNGKKAHNEAALVQINDVAEIFNHLSNTIDDFGLAEIAPAGGLNVNVFGGEVRSSGIAATIADATVTLTDNTPTSYLVFDYLTNTFKQVTSLQSNHALLYELTTSGGVITVFTDKRGLSFGINTASAIPVFADAASRDIALPSPADGMQVCLVSEGVYSDYLNGAWISRGNAATPNAALTVAGKVQLATQSEVNAGTDTGSTGAKLAVTPSILQTIVSDKLASNAEALAGTDNTKLMTPLRVAEYCPVASTTVAGKVEMATDAESLAGTDETRYINSKQLGLKNKTIIIPALQTQGSVGQIPVSSLYGRQFQSNVAQFINVSFVVPAGVTSISSIVIHGTCNVVSGLNIIANFDGWSRIRTGDAVVTDVSAASQTLTYPYGATYYGTTWTVASSHYDAIGTIQEGDYICGRLGRSGGDSGDTFPSDWFISYVVITLV